MGKPFLRQRPHLEEGKPTTIATPHSRFFIRRLASGNLLLVNHYKFTGRSHLTAQLSTDDGATWNDGLLLDERSGVSYPDGVQDKDGLIWITYDRDRGGAGEILLAKFKEEDVAAGKNVSGAVSLKQVVNKLDKPASAPKPAVKVTQELLNSIHVTPKLIFDPMPAYGQKYLPFAMAASMESTKKGRLWTCWAGGQDGPNAYLLASYSDDQGKSWRDPVFVIDPQAHGLEDGHAARLLLVRSEGAALAVLPSVGRHVRRQLQQLVRPLRRSRCGEARVDASRFTSASARR